MYITRIRIKNFRVIREIDINLDVNKNQIEKDVAKDRFKILDNKRVVSGVTALVGRNSVGKSTIIKALSFIKDVEIGFIRNETNNSKLKKIEDKENIDFTQYWSNSKKLFSNYFKYNCNNSSHKMEFEISFLGENSQKGNYLFSINKNGKVLRETSGDFGKKEYEGYFGKIANPLKDSSLISIAKEKFNDKSEILNCYSSNKMNFILENLLNNIGEKLTTQLLKLCDENIKGVKHYKTNNNRILIKGILLSNKKIQSEDLSSGTKQFIIICQSIVQLIKSKSKNGLLLLDEIEINMHSELINSILHMLIFIFKKYGIQSIITTHNLKALKPLISNKQIFSIDKEGLINKALKVSKIMKEHESILTKQDQGMVASYYDSDLIRNSTVDFLYEIT